jgi:hypothetical protein
VEPDPGQALGQGGRGAGERRQVHPPLDQGVVEHHDPEGAFGLGIQLRQPFGQGLHDTRIRKTRRSVRDRGAMPDGWRMTWGVATARMVDMDPNHEDIRHEPRAGSVHPLVPPSAPDRPGRRAQEPRYPRGTFMSLAIRPGKSTKRSGTGHMTISGDTDRRYRNWDV